MKNRFWIERDKDGNPTTLEPERRSREQIARERRQHEDWIRETWALPGLQRLAALMGHGVIQPRPSKRHRWLRKRGRTPAPIPRTPSLWRHLRAAHMVSKREAKLMAYPGRRFR